MDSLQKAFSLIKFGQADNKEIIGNVAIITAACLFVIFFVMLNTTHFGKLYKYVIFMLA
jgi:hypothetical protein